MKRNIKSVTSLVVVRFVFGLVVASMLGPAVIAAEDPLPTCCEYDWVYGCPSGTCTCWSGTVGNKPWVTICYSGGHCSPGEWIPYAMCQQG